MFSSSCVSSRLLFARVYFWRLRNQQVPQGFSMVANHGDSLANVNQPGCIPRGAKDFENTFLDICFFP